ncbi:MAG: glutaredoxin family protein [Cyanobacteria bacterium]|nr:glutaredoxin family protein [Cyanobacteria bacterium GSL.Bin21]
MKCLKIIARSLLISCTVIITLFFSTQMSVIAEQATVTVDFYYSKTCPHCAAEKPLLNYIEEHNEGVKVNRIEVNEKPDVWQNYLQENNIQATGVPRTVIGDRAFIGYSKEQGKLEYNPSYKAYIGYKNQIINAIEEELNSPLNTPESQNKVQEEKSVSTLPWSVFFLPLLYAISYPLLKRKLLSAQRQRYWIGGLLGITLLSVFSFIVLTPNAIIQNLAGGLPFPLFVSIIAFADGFNPCAFTVLIILLSLLTYTKSKTDMTIVGSTFILTSAVMYFGFIMAMVLVGSFFLEQYGQIALVILGAIVTAAGIINIKDYFFFKQSISLSLSEKQQLTITKKAGGIARQLNRAKVESKQFWFALGATILLAIFVNIIELGCTAILPVVYMTTLVNHCTTNVGLCYTTWTALYALIYILPLLVILVSFIYSFQSSRLNEDQGRILKLFSGVFMLLFGLIMLMKPQLLMLG